MDKTNDRAIGLKITGNTIHTIDNELDKGLIMEQKAIKIKATDNSDSLYPYPKFVREVKKHHHH